MFEYSDRSKWNNSIFLHLSLSIILWFPVVALFVYMAVELEEMYFYFLTFSVSLIWGLILFRRAQTKLVFPTIEISNSHIVVNTPISNRAVYNLGCIEGARFFWHVLYFRHNNWPILVPLPRMPKLQRKVLLDAIKLS